MLAVLMVVSLTACGRESVGTPGGELENGVAAIEDAMTTKPNESSSASTTPIDDLRDGSSTDTVATPGDFPDAYNFGSGKTMKVGAAVVTCRRGGNTATFDVLNKYFTMTGMPVASSQYWNMVYGGSAEEVAQDAEGLQTMRTLGRNMAFMMKSFQLGKEQIGLPQKEPLIFTNFHR